MSAQKLEARGINIYADQELLATICGGKTFVDKYESAKLLAAAPELLEALELAEKDLKSMPHSRGFEFTSLPKIRAAIAKAKSV